MKLNQVAKSAVFGLAVLLASSAFASSKGTVQVSEPFQVNGQTLAAGKYQLQWDGTGPNVEVSFLQGKKEVAKAPAKLVELGTAASNDSAAINHEDGKATISEVRFYGKKYVLAIGATEKSEMSGASSK
jgi:hypothetical protein